MSADRPALRIVRGAANAEEIAALTALLANAGPGEAAESPPPRGGWADPAHRMRAVMRPGGWASSGRW